MTSSAAKYADRSGLFWISSMPTEHRNAITRQSMTFRVTAYLCSVGDRGYRAISSFSAATNESTSSSVVSKAHIQRTTPSTSSQK